MYFHNANDREYITKAAECRNDRPNYHLLIIPQLNRSESRPTPSVGTNRFPTFEFNHIENQIRLTNVSGRARIFDACY